MNKFFILMIAIFHIYGCKKDGYTHYTAELVNNTNHRLKLLYYNSGKVSLKDTVNLFTKSSFKIADGTIKSSQANPSFTSNFGGDSVVVIYDDAYKITHYSNEPVDFAQKYYLFSSSRNVINASNFRYISKNTSKTSWETSHIYTFTEQDYIDAKP